ncbi:MAG: hypothetical protein NVS4B3_12500 [Gemmatimonadaceae bacterium]
MTDVQYCRDVWGWHHDDKRHPCTAPTLRAVRARTEDVGSGPQRADIPFRSREIVLRREVGPLRGLRYDWHRWASRHNPINLPSWRGGGSGTWAPAHDNLQVAAPVRAQGERHGQGSRRLQCGIACHPVAGRMTRSATPFLTPCYR